ncbi:N-acetyltransferase [Dehalobacterium formicoaceticum]|uniref:N-acetyltransferase n=1 Tax=Dehalobacterium formicoaceticum TaxID=51515 RepID=A0ABT1XZJ0_9FIRM|nr:N-acetyltransferase [Dehalobacterium formicoaceticum]MCR6544024.1 N-acetyltransferase [Dehalobacterium formicoaceticum]
MIYRKAKMTDVESIHRLIYNYANQGLMLARSRSSIYENLREFTVAEDGGTVAGIGGLHILWHDLGEIRSLAIDPSYTKQGIGRHLVELLEQEALALGLPKLFALTYQPVFFAKCGFQEVENNILPQKVWKECINCPKFPDCDEQAVLKILQK